MIRKDLFCLILLGLFGVSIGFAQSSEFPPSEEDIVVDIEAASNSLPNNSLIQIGQVGNVVSSSATYDGNASRINVTGASNSLRVNQAGTNNTYELYIQNGYNNTFDVMQRNNGNYLRKTFGDVQGVEMTIIQRGNARLEIDLSDVSVNGFSTTPLQGATIEQTPGANVRINSQNSGSNPIGIFNTNP